MAKENKRKKNCNTSKGLMLLFGLTTLGTRIISAFAVVAIAFGFCSIHKEAKVFNDCVEESIESGKTLSEGVRFCNGG